MKSFFNVILVWIPVIISAQNMRIGAGQNDIKIYLSDSFNMSDHIELQKQNRQGQFDAIHVFQVATKLEELIQNANLIPLEFKSLLDEKEILFEKVFSSLNSASTVDDILLSKLPNTLYMCGLAFSDVDVSDGNTYSYRLVVNGDVRQEESIAYGSAETHWSPVAYKSTYVEQDPKCTWSTNLVHQDEILTFDAWRSLPFTNQYQAIRPLKGFSSSGDTLFLTMRDTSIVLQGAYHYIIRTLDVFGSYGPVSEYVSAANFPPESQPSFVFIDAKGETKAPYIALRWKLRNPFRVNSISLFRSRKFNSDFVKIADFSPSDTSYRDPIDDVMESYFYYFEIHDRAGEQLPQSATVTNVSTYVPPVLPPHDVWVDTLGENVGIYWRPNGKQDRGYYVYKMENGSSDGMHIASPFIMSNTVDSVYLWVDTSHFLSTEKLYTYAVVAEGHAYNKSEFSEMHSIRPNRRTYIAPPSGLKLKEVGKDSFLLKWDDMTEFESSLMGYHVFARPKNDPVAADTQITDTLLYFETNHILLKNFDDQLEYAVKAFDLYGSQSALSLPVSTDDPFKLRFGPKYLTAFQSPKGIELKWNRPLSDKIAYYQVFRKSQGQNPTMIAQLDKDQTSFIDQNQLTAEERYQYYIIAVDESQKASLPSVPVYVRYYQVN